MDFTTAYILAGIGTALVFVWVILFLVYSKKFDEVIGAIDKKKYMLGEIYFIGFGIISLLKINMKSEKGRKKTHEISEIYGEKYADFYYYVVMGGSITYLVTLMPAAFLLGALANDLKICVMALAAAAVMYFYLDGEIKKSVNEKREEILADFPQMLSKITLLINAGMIIHDAWQKVAYTNDRPLYKEMQKACAEMGNGVSDRDAINNFAQRCSLKEIRKFASAINQNMEKGGSELSKTLKELTAVSWEEKRSRVKIKGAAVGTKLMLPSMLIFVGIIIMVLVPALGNF